MELRTPLGLDAGLCAFCLVVLPPQCVVTVVLLRKDSWRARMAWMALNGLLCRPGNKPC